MSYVTPILTELARTFRTTVPTYVLGAPMPPGKIAYYDLDTQKIYFGSRSPRPSTVAHEMAHHMHNYWGVSCRSRECEVYADMLEEWYRKSRRTFKCVNCNTQVPALNPKAVCFKCNTSYRVQEKPGGILPLVAAIAIGGTISGIIVALVSRRLRA